MLSAPAVRFFFPLLPGIFLFVIVPFFLVIMVLDNLQLCSIRNVPASSPTSVLQSTRR